MQKENVYDMESHYQKKEDGKESHTKKKNTQGIHKERQ